MCQLVCGITSVYTVMFVRYVCVINLEISCIKWSGESYRQVQRKYDAQNSILSGLGTYNLDCSHNLLRLLEIK